MQINTQCANLYASPSDSVETTSQALFGERVQLIQQQQHWSEVQLQNDGYTGFLRNDQLIEFHTDKTHRVIARTTPLFARASIKSPVSRMLVLGSELALSPTEHEQFLCTDEGRFIWQPHTRYLHWHKQGDLVATAEALFLGAPYLWGGRTPLGLDCSALVQLSAMLHGWQLPRDTKDQVSFFSNQITKQLAGSENSQLMHPVASTINYEQRQADDLVYWPGHVGILLDKQTLLHATAHSLQVCKEPLQSVEQRAGHPESIWRLPSRVEKA